MFNKKLDTLMLVIVKIALLILGGWIIYKIAYKKGLLKGVNKGCNAGVDFGRKFYADAFRNTIIRMRNGKDDALKDYINKNTDRCGILDNYDAMYDKDDNVCFYGLVDNS